MRDPSGRFLLVRKRGTSRFMQPGGKIEAGETPAECVVREAREELGIDLDSSKLIALGDWEEPAANEPDQFVHGYVFAHPFVEGIQAQSEIEEVLWLHPSDAVGRDDLAPLFVRHVLHSHPDAWPGPADFTG